MQEKDELINTSSLSRRNVPVRKTKDTQVWTAKMVYAYTSKVVTFCYTDEMSTPVINILSGMNSGFTRI